MSHIHRWLLIVMMTVVFYGSSFSSVQADNHPQVILILINQLSFIDYTIYSELPGFKQLEEQGAKGAMNVNSAAGRTDENSYLSIGSGSRGVGTIKMAGSFMADEMIGSQIRAKDIYFQQTGEKITSKDSILFLSIGRLQQQQQKFSFKISALGEVLKENGYKSRVFGNSDTDEKIRYAPLIVMDKEGVSFGDIGTKTNMDDPSRPYGIKTNYSYLLEQLKESVSLDASLIVFDLGDLYRYEQFKEQMKQEHADHLKKEIFYEMGIFIQDIIKELHDQQTLIVASPMVDGISAKEKYLLAPIWIYHDPLEGKMLTSGTTKREGLVTNIDLAPTILKSLRIKEKPVEMLGESIEAVDSKVNLYGELQHIATVYQLRSKVLYVYVVWKIFILITAMLAWLKKGKIKQHFAQTGLLSMLFLPLLLLFSAFWTPSNAYQYIGVIIFISLFAARISHRFNPLPLFLGIGLFTFLSITLDTFFDNPFMKRSFLGYDPIIGARFYGIGNEYTGVYLGSALLFTGSLLQLFNNRRTLRISFLILIMVSFILLLPTLGTNAGGAVSAILSAGFVYWISRKSKWNIKRIGMLFFMLLIGILALIFINFLFPVEEQSHIGRILRQVYEGNTSVIWQTIQRKIAMNWKLIQVSSWSKVIVTSIVAIGILFLKKSFYSLKSKYPVLFDHFYALIVGAFVSLIVNDSGVVAASTMIVYFAVPVIYLALKED